jgi:adenine deaminase
MALAEVLPAFTSNTADVWQLCGKGRLAPGGDADMVFVDRSSLQITGVMARGRLLAGDRGAMVASKAA